VKPGPALDNLIAAIAETCRRGLEPSALRAAVLPRLRRAVPIDALWWATVDPATLLFTQAYTEELPDDSGPYFVENELLLDDVNKWTELARDPRGARTLLEATERRPAESARYRDVFEPLGLEDELRVVLRARGVTWGFMCLHRERGSAFSPDEVAFVRRIAPHLAEGIRRGLLAAAAVDAAASPDAPGLILLAEDDSVISTNAPAERWLEELGRGGSSLPIELHAVAGRLRGEAGSGVQELCVRTPAGRWAVLQASWLPRDDSQAVAVIIQPATLEQAAPVAMMAYGLTEQERAVSGLVFHGLSTKAIAQELRITPHTVQDHLKAIFEKTGVRSRRELTATVLRERYLPHLRARDRPGAAGHF
jgi:DNA-binding CsgD family transcriptional regulator